MATITAIAPCQDGSFFRIERRTSPVFQK